MNRRRFLAVVVAASALLLGVPRGLAEGATVKRVFEFDCTDQATFRAARLGAATQDALQHLPDHGVADWGDRAVSVRFGGDGISQKFVPLTCGATCNCTWAAFSGTPPRFLGTVDGCVLGVRLGTSGQPEILAYGHMSAGDGTLVTYVLRDGTYYEIARTNIEWEAAARKLGCEISSERCCK